MEEIWFVDCLLCLERNFSSAGNDIKVFVFGLFYLENKADVFMEQA